MTTTPFRTAFWATALAFMMTVMLAVPNPDKFRLAMRSQRDNPSLLPHERALLAHREQLALEAAEEQAMLEAQQAAEMLAQATAPQPVVEQPAVTEQPVIEPVPALVEHAERVQKPIMIAATDAAVGLGITSEPSLSDRQSESSMPSAPAVPAWAEEKTANDKTIASTGESPKPQQTAMNSGSTNEAETPRQITVPEPVPASISVPLLVFNDGPTAAKPTESAPISKPAQWPASEPSMQPSTGNVAAVVTEPAATFKTEDLSSEQSLHTIVKASTQGKYSFKFSDAPIQDVLQVIAEQYGNSVIVSPNITGNFSGEFTNVEPALALGMVVKAHGFTVSRRGTYLLIGVRENRKDRPQQNITRY